MGIGLRSRDREAYSPRLNPTAQTVARRDRRLRSGLSTIGDVVEELLDRLDAQSDDAIIEDIGKHPIAGSLTKSEWELRGQIREALGHAAGSVQNFAKSL
jgi:hypothetical protein